MSESGGKWIAWYCVWHHPGSVGLSTFPGDNTSSCGVARGQNLSILVLALFLYLILAKRLRIDPCSFSEDDFPSVPAQVPSRAQPCLHFYVVDSGGHLP